MEIGIFSKTVDKPTLKKKLDSIRSYGIKHIQFNLSCVGLPHMPEQISPLICHQISQTLEKKSIVMSAISGTYNMAHPEVQVRQDGQRRLQKIIRVCKDLGTNIITLCTGSRDRKNMWKQHPDNGSPVAWRDLCHSISQALPLAEEHRIFLAFEPEVSNIVNSAQKGRKLINDMQSKNLKVVMDGANIFNYGELARMHSILDQAFDLLGSDIVLAHAKDLDRDGGAGNRPAGKGILDYDYYINWLREVGYNGPILLHSLKESEIKAAVSFLHQKIG